MEDMEAKADSFVPTWENSAGHLVVSEIISHFMATIPITLVSKEKSFETPLNKEFETMNSKLLKDINEYSKGKTIADTFAFLIEQIKGYEKFCNVEALVKLGTEWFERARDRWFECGEKLTKKEFVTFLRKDVFLMDEHEEVISMPKGLRDIFGLTDADIKLYYELVEEKIRNYRRGITNPKYNSKEEEKKSIDFKQRFATLCDDLFKDCDLDVSEIGSADNRIVAHMVHFAKKIVDVVDSEILEKNRHPVDVSSDIDTIYDAIITRFQTSFDPNDSKTFFYKMIIANKEAIQNNEQIAVIQEKLSNEFEFVRGHAKEILDKIYKDKTATNEYSDDNSFGEMVDYLYSETIASTASMVPEFIVNLVSDVFKDQQPEPINEKHPDAIDVEHEVVEKGPPAEYVDEVTESGEAPFVGDNDHEN